MVLAAVKTAYQIIDSPEGEVVSQSQPVHWAASNDTQRRKHIQSIVPHFYNYLQNHPTWKALQSTGTLRIVDEDWRSQDVKTPIIPLITRPGECRGLAAQLLKEGFLTHPVQHPIVPLDSERVRVVVHADNTPEQVELFIEAVMEWARQRCIAPSRL